jgi:hypothetical protein
VGSIPITRSILRLRQAIQGKSSDAKFLIACEKYGHLRLIKAAVVAPDSHALPQVSHVAPHLGITSFLSANQR